MKSRTIKIIFGVVSFFIAISLITNIVVYRNYIKKVNYDIMSIISAVKNKYPNVTDEEITDILHNREQHFYDLEKYGVNTNDVYMLENTRIIHNVLITSNVILVSFLGITLFFILLSYIKNRKNKVCELTDYIKEINKKNYILKLDENSEDELSVLQNEIYKITVFLKEQSENAITDKMNVKDSLSDISHQLKTPLTSIMIGLDNIIDNPGMDDKTKDEFLYDIKKQIENINFLITSILKLSRFDTNVIKFTKQEINLKMLLNEVLKNLENIAGNKNIKIKLMGKDDVSFAGDYKWEMEALTNIIKNGIEHLKNNGTIKIDYSKLSVYTQIVIEDNGSGIEKDDLKHIFERFYKGKNSDKDSIGIGLSLSKRIIENDNGYITVYSEHNRGTKFVIKYINY